MKKAFIVAPMIVMLLAACALATRWYEVDESGSTKPQVQTQPAPDAPAKPPVQNAPDASTGGDRVFNPVSTWMYTYGGPGEDVAMGLARYKTGYMMAGYTFSFGAGGSDAWMVNIGADGKSKWDVKYGVSLEERAQAIASSDTGGYCISGLGMTNKMLALKMRSGGGIDWEYNFGGSQPAVSTSVDFAPGGGCVVAGYFSRAPGQDCDGYAWMTEIDAAGKQLWQWNDAPACTSWLRGVKRTQFGTYIVAGEKYNGANLRQYWIFKLDEDRIIRWEIVATAAVYRDYHVQSINEAPGGSFVVAGGARLTEEHAASDGWLIKVDAAGNTVWEHHYNAPGDPDVINEVIPTDEGYIGVGYTMTAAGNYDGSIFGLDEYGSIKWHKMYGGAGTENFISIEPSVDDDGYVISGATDSRGAGQFDYLILKTDRRGVCRGCNF